MNIAAHGGDTCGLGDDGINDFHRTTLKSNPQFRAFLCAQGIQGFVSLGKTLCFYLFNFISSEDVRNVNAP
jgi:hypothetical protein